MAKTLSMTALQAGRHWFKSSIAHIPLNTMVWRFWSLKDYFAISIFDFD